MGCVVAIAVQGLMNRSPKRSPDHLLVPRGIAPIGVWRSWSTRVDRNIVHSTDVLEIQIANRGEKLFTLHYPVALGKWFVEDDFFGVASFKNYLVSDQRYRKEFLVERCVEVSQKEVEERVSKIYTDPYPVTRVTDQALHVAWEMLGEGVL